jgi:radical SAM superfamily enzyme YgiQ (UPF0313 family)
MRRVSLETAVRQLASLTDMEPTQIKFVDRTFNIDKDFAFEIWRHLILNDNSVTNFHFEISGALLDGDALALLKTARPGLFQFEIGVQSTNTQTLAAINRPDCLEKLYENVRMLIDNRNIHIHLDLIAGLPYEDWSSFRDSFNSVYSLSPHMLQLGFLKLLKGSPLYADAEKYKIICKTSAPYEVLSTAWLTFDEILRLKKIEDALEICYNSGRFRNTMKFLLRFFESPFELYDALAAELGMGEGINKSKPRFVRELYEFGAKYNESAFRDLLKFDLCLNEPPRNLPDWLRDDVSSALKKQMNIPKGGNIHLEKFSYNVSGSLEKRETYILFDYGVKPPIAEGVNCEFRLI